MIKVLFLISLFFGTGTHGKHSDIVEGSGVKGKNGVGIKRKKDPCYVINRHGDRHGDKA